MLISNPNKQLSNISILGIHVLSTCRDWKGAALSESHLLLWIFITITSWIPLFWLVYDHPSRNSWFSTTMTQACKLNHHLRYPFSSKPLFWVLVNLSFQTNQADLLTPFRNPPIWISGNTSSTGCYASKMVRTFDWVSPTDAVASSKRSLARRSAIRMGRSTPDLPDARSGSP